MVTRPGAPFFIAVAFMAATLVGSRGDGGDVPERFAGSQAWVMDEGKELWVRLGTGFDGRILEASGRASGIDPVEASSTLGPVVNEGYAMLLFDRTGKEPLWPAGGEVAIDVRSQDGGRSQGDTLRLEPGVPWSGEVVFASPGAERTTSGFIKVRLECKANVELSYLALYQKDGGRALLAHYDQDSTHLSAGDRFEPTFNPRKRKVAPKTPLLLFLNGERKVKQDQDVKRIEFFQIMEIAAP